MYKTCLRKELERILSQKKAGKGVLPKDWRESLAIQAAVFYALSEKAYSSVADGNTCFTIPFSFTIPVNMPPYRFMVTIAEEHIQDFCKLHGFGYDATEDGFVIVTWISNS